jgi:hypothetical protein
MLFFVIGFLNCLPQSVRFLPSDRSNNLLLFPRSNPSFVGVRAAKEQATQPKEKFRAARFALILTYP